MFKIMTILIFIVLIILGGYISGYVEGKEIATASCPEVETKIEWRELHVPIPCNQQNLTKVYECKNVTITDEKIVYKEVSGNKYKADIYYQIAVKEQDNFYEDIKYNRFSECEEKLTKSRDYFFTSIGYYQLSEQDFTYKIKAIENYIKVLNIINNYCKNHEEKKWSNVEDDYEKYYDKYTRFSEFSGDIIIKIK